MARPLRIEYPGAVYHVTARGNATNDIFHSDTDRDTFLKILSGVVKRYNWLCHAYCLMDNHYHLLVETPDGNLSRGMRQLTCIVDEERNEIAKGSGNPSHVYSAWIYSEGDCRSSGNPLHDGEKGY